MATERAIEFLQADPDLRLLFLYLGLVDEAGHGLIQGGTGGLPPWSPSGDESGQDEGAGGRRRRGPPGLRRDVLPACSCIAPCLPAVGGGGAVCRTGAACAGANSSSGYRMACDPAGDGGAWRGWGSHNYYAAAKAADQHLARLLRSLEEAGMLDSTLIAVVADHGGFRYTHGAFLQESDMYVPLILAGPAVIAAHHLRRASTLDVTPTLLHALGVAPSPDIDGRVLLDAFRFPSSAAGPPATGGAGG